MIEGEAEILQSSAKPTVLQGRPGMTIKFVEADEPSKIVIGELEKARLAMRPPPPTVPPRPSNIPAEPRPTPPSVGGRIDASNALAECVVIGDVALLRDIAGAPRTVGDAGSGKSKFVVPSIPRPNSPSQAGSERVKTPTAPPPVPPLPSNPKLTSIGFPAIDKLPAKPDAVGAPKPITDGDATTIGEAPLKPPGDDEATAVGQVPVRASVITDEEATSIGEMSPNPPAAKLGKLTMGWDTVGKAEPDAAAKPASGVPSTTSAAKSGGISTGVPAATSASSSGATATKSGATRASTEIGSGISGRHAAPSKSGPVANVPSPDPAKPPPTPASAKNQRMTSIGFPAMARTPFETQQVGVVPPPKDGDPAPPLLGKKPTMPTQPRGKTPTAPPPGLRHPTPAAPLPVVRMPATKSAPYAPDVDEKTDLSSIPVAANDPASTRQQAFDALPPESPVPQVDPIGGTDIVPAVSRSGGMRASEIMAAIPTEDWTMTPDAPAPTVLTPADKASAPAEESEPTPAPGSPPKGPPTGNWTISLDPVTGWSEVEKLPAAAPAPAPEKPKRRATAGNPSLAVASDKAINAVEWEEKPTGIGEAKIEIDPTLMQPHKPMPALDEDEAESAPLAAPPPIPSRGDENVPLPPSRGFPATANLPSPGAFGAGPGMLQLPPSPPASAFSAVDARGAAPSKKRLLVIGICAAAVIALIAIVSIVLLRGDKKPKQTAATDTGSGSAAIVAPLVPVTPLDAAAASAEPQIVVETGSATETGSGSAAPVIDPPPPVASGPCKVDVNSVPSGADILFEKKKIATTPGTIELPCGTASTLTLKKAKFLATPRSITPSPEKPNKVTIKLGKMMFSIKVTSTPAGATITVGGKAAGVTPGTVKVAGFEAKTIKISKPGFAPDSAKVTAKANGQAHHVVLKKASRR